MYLLQKWLWPSQVLTSLLADSFSFLTGCGVFLSALYYSGIPGVYVPCMIQFHI